MTIAALKVFALDLSSLSSPTWLSSTKPTFFTFLTFWTLDKARMSTVLILSVSPVRSLALRLGQLGDGVGDGLRGHRQELVAGEGDPALVIVINTIIIIIIINGHLFLMRTLSQSRW